MAASEEGATELAEAAAAETERIVGWLRLLAIALIGVGEEVAGGGPTEAGFLEAIAAYSVWGLSAVAWAYLRPVKPWFVLAGTAIDVVAITALVSLSGGAFSDARAAYFLIPIAVAFRFRPLFTAVASVVTIAAYLTQAFADSASSREGAERFIALHAGYLAWVGLAAVLLSYVLARRTQRVAELAAARQHLLADALTADARERRVLAEGLHDHAIQNLLSARHELEEATEEAPHPALWRADAALSETVKELREAVFELHPFVLEQAGLEAALRAVGQRAGRQGGFRLHLDLEHVGPSPQDPLLLATARELLANAVQHAGARNVWLRLGHGDSCLWLSVRDDGAGFDPGSLAGRLSAGHVGLATNRERITSAGGSFEIRAAPGQGTSVEIRVPAVASERA